MRLIDEKEALEKINEIPDRQMNGVTVAKALAQCKTIEAEYVRYGRWIDRGEWVECSECGTVGSPQWKRCPVCEAKMETLD